MIAISYQIPIFSFICRFVAHPEVKVTALNMEQRREHQRQYRQHDHHHHRCPCIHNNHR